MNTSKYACAVSVAGLTAATLALAVSASSASAARGPSVATHGSAVTHSSVSPAKRGNCYSNLKGDNGTGIVSQNFESAFDIYDSAGADNFDTVKTCNTVGVYAPGQYFNGSGPAASETVTFYDNSAGEPGGTIDSQTAAGVDAAGTFTVPLAPVALPPGPKWVSVVANMNFSTGGEWGWELTSNVKQGSEGQWENPGNGFSSGCTTWGDVTNCVGFSGDFMVTVLK